MTFLGVSTLLFDDGKTAILTDGFFSRPSRLRTLFTKLEPDRKLIARYLQRAGIKKLEAVIVLHSHLDHAFDAPEVARQTDALLIGSESTANIARGYGFPERDICVVQDGAEMCLGRFVIKFLPSGHSPLALLSRFHFDIDLLEGEIEEPLKLPAHWYDYKEGDCYSILIEHDGKSILVQASAGFKKAALDGHHANVVFLGIGTLGHFQPSDMEDYWNEVVEAVKPQRIIPIHWDDFSEPLDRPLIPMRRSLDDLDKSMSFFLARAKERGIDLKMLPAWIKADPFAGLDNKQSR